MSVNITVDGAKEAAAVMEKCAKDYKKKVNKTLRSEGTKLRKEVRDKALKAIKIRTGNYMNGISVQSPYKYYKENQSEANDSVKVYGSHKRTLIKAGKIGYGRPKKGKSVKYGKNGRVRYANEHEARGAFHTHLIEYGHKIGGFYANKTDKKETKAFKIYSEAGEAFSARWQAACEALAAELVKEFD